MMVSLRGERITKYAWRKCITITIRLLRGGCFSIRMVSAPMTQGRASMWSRRHGKTPSLCSGGIPSTSHCTTVFVESSSRHIARFRMPTSIDKIVIILDYMNVFNHNVYVEFAAFVVSFVVTRRMLIGHISPGNEHTDNQ